MKLSKKSAEASNEKNSHYKRRGQTGALSQYGGKMGLPDAIIEKDFWVCWMLDYLFHRSVWKDKIAFKGGTSLSKSYGLIERFSEDIDLILDWRVLGYSIDEPWEDRSNRQQEIFNEEANARTERFLSEIFVPAVKSDLLSEPRNVDCYVDSNDPQTVIFAYSNSFSETSILPVIRLEIGALAAWTPAAVTPIKPYAAECYPQLFEQSQTEVLTVLPERTFWEKATILHMEAYRPEGRSVPARYSRHFYDLYKMANSSVKDRALADLELLDRVVAFKQKFYRCPWAKYELAKVGTLMLLPPDYNLKAFETDYEHMQNMLFGQKPTFVEILSGLVKLQNEINSL